MANITVRVCPALDTFFLNISVQRHLGFKRSTIWKSICTTDVVCLFTSDFKLKRNWSVLWHRVQPLSKNISLEQMRRDWKLEKEACLQLGFHRLRVLDFNISRLVCLVLNPKFRTRFMFRYCLFICVHTVMTCRLEAEKFPKSSWTDERNNVISVILLEIWPTSLRPVGKGTIVKNCLFCDYYTQV